MKHLPDVKLIMMVRNPLEQIPSHWVWYVSQIDPIRAKRLGMSLDFLASLKASEFLVDSAMYWKQLQLYRDHVPDDRIKLLFFEDYKADPDAVMRDVFSFLGVDASFQCQNVSERKTRLLNFGEIEHGHGFCVDLLEFEHWQRTLAHHSALSSNPFLGNRRPKNQSGITKRISLRYRGSSPMSSKSSAMAANQKISGRLTSQVTRNCPEDQNRTRNF